jgi:hypothetical protein
MQPIFQSVLYRMLDIIRAEIRAPPANLRANGNVSSFIMIYAGSPKNSQTDPLDGFGRVMSGEFITYLNFSEYQISPERRLRF